MMAGVEVLARLATAGNCEGAVEQWHEPVAAHGVRLMNLVFTELCCAGYARRSTDRSRDASDDGARIGRSTRMHCKEEADHGMSNLRRQAS